MLRIQAHICSSASSPVSSAGLPQTQVLCALPASRVVNGSASSDLVLFIIKRNLILLTM